MTKIRSKSWTLVAGALILSAGQASAQPSGGSPLASYLKANKDVDFSHLDIADVRGSCPLIIETGGIGDHWNKTLDWTRIKSVKIYPNNPDSVVLHGAMLVERTADRSGRGDQTNSLVFTGPRDKLVQVLKLLREHRQACGGKPGPDE